MKTKKFLSIAALALVGAVMTGCSSDEEIVVVPVIETPQQPADNVVTLTTTIGFDGDDATTRFLDYDKDAKKLTKTFAAGDQVAVIYKNTSDQTVKALSTALTTTDISTDGQKAELTVTLTNPKASEAVRFIYPAAMALDPATTALVKDDAATVNYAALATQDGTQATLGSTLDLAIYDGTLTSDAKLPEKLTLENKLAICAYFLKNSDGSSDLNIGITSLTVYAGSDTYTVTRTGSTDPIFVAIRPLTTATDISYVASDGTNTYGKKVTGKQYDADNVYNLGLRMNALITSPAVGQVIGDNGMNYAAGSLPSGVKAVAMIAYVGTAGSADASSSAYRGLAIALNDAGDGTWGKTGEYAGLTCYGEWKTGTANDAMNDLAGINNTNVLAPKYATDPLYAAAKIAKEYKYDASVAAGATPIGTSQWFLPTIAQWNMMVKSVTGSSDDLVMSGGSSVAAHTASNINSLCSASLSGGGYYWMSTEAGDSYVWFYGSWDGGINVTPKDNVGGLLVRPFLAF